MRTVTVFLLLFLMTLPALAQESTYQDRLYGQVITRDGVVHEGFIQWDKNEASWVDILDGSKRLEHTLRDRDRHRKMRIFGIEIEWGDDDHSRGEMRQSGIRLGHVLRLENTGGNRALLTLRSGQEIEFSNGSTDIGNNVRSIIVEEEYATAEFRWRDIDHVDFLAVPRNVRAPHSGQRLFGTLTTQDGHAFSGFICWDIDEVLEEHILDGDDERGRDRDIAFGDIAEIARNSSRSARVTLKTGEELVLDGSNDVNNENRDILVLDPNLGQVRVPWKAFDNVVFEPADYSLSYDRFYKAGPLIGSVVTRDGDTYTGSIRWDNDEAYTWEFINGENDDLDFKVELGLIRRIERISSQAARVILFDGRILELRGSNDVNRENSGIVITDKDGDVMVVDWNDFESATFDKR